MPELPLPDRNDTTRYSGFVGFKHAERRTEPEVSGLPCPAGIRHRFAGAAPGGEGARRRPWLGLPKARRLRQGDGEAARRGPLHDAFIELYRERTMCVAFNSSRRSLSPHCGSAGKSRRGLKHAALGRYDLQSPVHCPPPVRSVHTVTLASMPCRCPPVADAFDGTESTRGGELAEAPAPNQNHRWTRARMKCTTAGGRWRWEVAARR